MALSVPNNRNNVPISKTITGGYQAKDLGPVNFSPGSDSLCNQAHTSLRELLYFCSLHVALLKKTSRLTRLFSLILLLFDHELKSTWFNSALKTHRKSSVKKMITGTFTATLGARKTLAPPIIISSKLAYPISLAKVQVCRNTTFLAPMGWVRFPWYCGKM